MDLIVLTVTSRVWESTKGWSVQYKFPNPTSPLLVFTSHKCKTVRESPLNGVDELEQSAAIIGKEMEGGVSMYAVHLLSWKVPSSGLGAPVISSTLCSAALQKALNLKETMNVSVEILNVVVQKLETWISYICIQCSKLYEEHLPVTADVLLRVALNKLV